MSFMLCFFDNIIPLINKLSVRIHASTFMLVIRCNSRQSLYYLVGNGCGSERRVTHEGLFAPEIKAKKINLIKTKKLTCNATKN